MNVREGLRKVARGRHHRSVGHAARGHAPAGASQHGAVLVGEGGTIHGILSERHLLRAGAEDPAMLLRERVSDRMTRGVIEG
jgi:hypothetical protein